MSSTATTASQAAVRTSRAAIFEGAGLTAAYIAFTQAQNQLGDNVTLAQANAAAVRHLEGGMARTIEHYSNQWVAAVDLLAGPAALIYALVLLCPPMVLIWLWLRHRTAYVRLRTSLLVMTFGSLPFFALFPVAPPRLHIPGVIDVVEKYKILGSATDPGSPDAANLYAAVPSLHVAWAVWCAYAVWYVVRLWSPRAAHLAWIFLAVVAVDVIVTGNHYVFDVAAGVLLASSAILLVDLAAGARRRRRARAIRVEPHVVPSAHN